MKPIRFYIAMLVSRATYTFMKLIGRNASHFPGAVALRICPNVLKYLEVPKTTVFITGTNGKTTTTNLVNDFLISKNVNLISNTAGSNIEGGIITALNLSTSFSGKTKKDVAIFEVDEKITPYIFPYIQPDVLLVTNLYRDSYKRNAHVGYIVDILDKSIPKSSHLILNGDDVLASNLSVENPRTYFSIAKQDFETETKDSIIQDAPYCPICGHELIYDFKRYHHIGQVHCDHCQYKTPEIDYLVKEINNEQLILIEHGEEFIYKNKIRNITDIYNKLSAISILRHLGYSHLEIREEFDQEEIKVVDTRYEESKVNGKSIISVLAKDQNPVANSRVYDFVRSQKDWGTKTLVFMNEDNTHNPNFSEVENTSWHYEADFEYLNDPQIKKIYCIGNRVLDFKTRLVLAGVDEAIITTMPPSDTLDIPIETDSVILLHDILNGAHVKKFRKSLEAEARK